MSAREAAIQVLSEAGEPLHAEEITKRILDNRLWATSGKTPGATIEAQICTDMQKRGCWRSTKLASSARRTISSRSKKKPSRAPPMRNPPRVKQSDGSAWAWVCNPNPDLSLAFPQDELGDGSDMSLGNGHLISRRAQPQDVALNVGCQEKQIHDLG